MYQSALNTEVSLFQGCPLRGVPLYTTLTGSPSGPPGPSGPAGPRKPLGPAAPAWPVSPFSPRAPYTENKVYAILILLIVAGYLNKTRDYNSPLAIDSPIVHLLAIDEHKRL